MRYLCLKWTCFVIVNLYLCFYFNNAFSSSLPNAVIVTDIDGTAFNTEILPTIEIFRVRSVNQTYFHGSDGSKWSNPKLTHNSHTEEFEIFEGESVLVNADEMEYLQRNGLLASHRQDGEFEHGNLFQRFYPKSLNSAAKRSQKTGFVPGLYYFDKNLSFRRFDLRSGDSFKNQVLRMIELFGLSMLPGPAMPFLSKVLDDPKAALRLATMTARKTLPKDLLDGFQVAKDNHLIANLPKLSSLHPVGLDKYSIFAESSNPNTRKVYIFIDQFLKGMAKRVQKTTENTHLVRHPKYKDKFVSMPVLTFFDNDYNPDYPEKGTIAQILRKLRKYKLQLTDGKPVKIILGLFAPPEERKKAGLIEDTPIVVLNLEDGTIRRAEGSELYGDLAELHDTPVMKNLNEDQQMNDGFFGEEL